MLPDLFGTKHISEMIFDNFKLPRYPGNDLPEKKILAIAKTDCIISSDKLFYYPSEPDTPETLAEEKEK